MVVNKEKQWFGGVTLNAQASGERHQTRSSLPPSIFPFRYIVRAHAVCEDLPLPLAHAGDKKVKRFHFSEIIGRLPYMRATVTPSGLEPAR